MTVLGCTCVQVAEVHVIERGRLWRAQRVNCWTEVVGVVRTAGWDQC